MSKNKNLLPFKKTISDTYSITWQNRGIYFKILLNALYFYLPLIVCFEFIAFKLTSNSAQGSLQILSGWSYLITIFGLGLAQIILNLLLTATIAVPWHNYVINKTPPFVAVFPPSKVSIKYAFYTVLIALVVFAPILFSYGGLALIPLSYSKGLILPISLVLILIVSFLFYATVIVTSILPAIALGRKDLSLRTVFSRVKFNYWRIVFAGLICNIPYFCIMITALVVSTVLVALLGSTIGISASTVIITSIIHLVNFAVATSFSLTLLSFIYKHFFGDNE
jgi:hypothetical protein